MPSILEINPYPDMQEIFSLYKTNKNAVFLDSSLVNDLGRYSIIGINSYLDLEEESGNNSVVVNGEKLNCSFEEYLRKYLHDNREINTSNLPMVSGAIGYFSYDYGRKLMGIPSRHEKELEIKEAHLSFYDNFIIEDRHENKLFIIGNGKLEDGLISCNKIKSQIDGIKNNTDDRIKNYKYSDKSLNGEKIMLASNFEKDEYKRAIDKMINYIIEGDIYIVNMTRQILVDSNIDPYEFFNALRKSNPSPFGAYMNYGDYQIISASPERFIQLVDDKIITRPIKGTRRRGVDKVEDTKLKKELQESDKDKSELLMIVDLERNDLNKICKPGSVLVDNLFGVEAYATVFHLIAEVSGRLKEDKNFVDILEATFPGGSITGSPKYRAMELIDEVESSRRNLYTGSIGYVSLDGNCDLNIVIRTAIHKNGKYHIGVGGGITCESDLEFEYEETDQKAKALIQALNIRRGE